MALRSWPGLIAVILAIISFYGTTYLVIALNTGWRFGYWITGAVFGVLMVLLSLFWIINPVGPRGEEPRWVSIATGKDRIAQASLDEEPLSSPARYPSGPWEPAPKGDTEQADALTSAVTTCLTTAPEKLTEEEKETCTEAQTFMPDERDIPVIEGSAVAVTPEATEVRFTSENGAQLGQVTVVPTTHDPRVAENAVKGRAMGEPFQLLFVHNKGSLLIPPIASLLIFGIFAAVHLAGLHRAEQRKLSPMAA